MVFIALYNTEYRRQFEVLISDEVWNRLRKKYGLYDGVLAAIRGHYKPINKKLDTRKRRKQFRNFVDVVAESPMDNLIKIAASKRDMLQKQMKGKDLVLVGKGEYEVKKRISERGGRRG